MVKSIQYKLSSFQTAKRPSSLKTSTGWSTAGHLASEKMEKIFEKLPQIDPPAQETENDNKMRMMKKRKLDDFSEEVILSFSPMISHKFCFLNERVTNGKRDALLAHRFLVSLIKFFLLQSVQLWQDDHFKTVRCVKTPML